MVPCVHVVNDTRKVEEMFENLSTEVPRSSGDCNLLERHDSKRTKGTSLNFVGEIEI